ncbi:hypothetical protein CHUAL_008807 [Chamberlinius hualienensis]
MGILNTVKGSEECLNRCQPPISICMKVSSSVKCLCTYNGKTLDLDEECLPSPTNKTDSNSSNGVLLHPDLAEIFDEKPVDGVQWNSSVGNAVTNSTAASHNGSGQLSLLMILSVTLSTFVFLIFFLLVMCCLRRRYKKRCQNDVNSGLNFWCRWQRPRAHLGLQTLGKSSFLDNQQFTVNPNYYSAPPEMAILKSLMHLEICGDRLAFIDLIGEGCFGKVFKGAYQKTDVELCDVAIKILKENSTSEIQLDFLREVEIMSSFEHENILALLGVVVAENTPWMVFEFMEYGDLAELLRKNTLNFWGSSDPSCKITKMDLPWLAKQVASGMSYLSSQHFVHRDLATRNCLVGKGPIIKISDFGMTRDIYTSDYYKIGGSRMLPVRWMAPESVMYGKFTLETDVWSFGVVLWEIFAFGKQPYYGHSNEEVVKLIRQGILLSPPEECPLYVCQLMEMCWRTNPYDRIKFPQIYQILHSKCDPDIKPVTNGVSESLSPCEISRLNSDVDNSSSSYLVPRTLNSVSD